MSINEQHISYVLDYFHSKCIRMSRSNEWLSGCCNYYAQMDPQVNLTNLYNFVYEQWLLADLRDVGEPCLPAITNDVKLITIRGDYPLQVDVIVDVSDSYYSQLEKLKRARSRNGAILAMEIDDEETQEEKMKTSNWQKKKNRTLKLICTDGVNTVVAMEYEPILELKEPYVPGLKILIKGPLECRRGIFLLTRNNLRILGGESDSVISENSLESILTRELNRQRIDDPIVDAALPPPLNAHEFDRDDSSIHDSQNATSTNPTSVEKTPVVGIACPIIPECRSTLLPSSIENSPSLERMENDSMSIRSSDNDFSGNRYSVNAFVKKLTSKPRIKNDEGWHLSVEIEQCNGATMEVSFSDIVVEKLFGFSAVEVKAQREQMNQNLSVKERIDKIIKEGIAKILSLKGKFDLKILSDDSKPVVTSVTPIG